MIVTFLPTTTVTYCIIGITPDDRELIAEGVQPNIIDLAAGIPHGIALPSVLQIILVDSEADLAARINKAIQSKTGEPFDGEWTHIDAPEGDDRG